MCRAELFDIDDGSGPQAINLGGQLTGQVALLAMELVVGADQLVQLGFDGGEEMSGVPQTIGQAGGYSPDSQPIGRSTANGVVLAALLGQQWVELVIGQGAVRLG